MAVRSVQQPGWVKTAPAGTSVCRQALFRTAAVEGEGPCWVTLELTEVRPVAGSWVLSLLPQYIEMAA